MTSPSDGALRFARGFVSNGTTRLHYARAGEGPVVVMLHASPCSAKAMAPIQQLWARHFTTVAFDLPGFGMSEALPLDQIETEDLADAVAAGMRRLGITKAALYGRHTGAGVAVEVAHRHPDLCSMVLTDGFPVFASPYSAERLREYMVCPAPSWEGSHLVWTWFRYREQHVFWPWDRPFAESRAKADVPSLEQLHRGTVELLEAGPDFGRVYASAFRHAGLGMIGQLKVPVCFGNRPGDSQHRTMSLYPASAWVKEFSRDPLEAAVEERQVLALHPGQAVLPEPRSSIRRGAEGYREDYLDTASGQTFACAAGMDRSARPVLILADLPGACVLHRELVAEFGSRRPALCFDFWGHGESRPVSLSASAPELWCRQTLEVMQALDLERPHVVAIGASAMVLGELIAREPAAISSAVYWSPPVIADEQRATFLANYAPSLDPSPEGAHLLRLWHHLRDQELFWPCFDQRHGTARSNPPRLDVESLNRRALALLKQPLSYRPTWEAIWSYRLRQSMAASGKRAILVTSEAAIFSPLAELASKALGVAAINVPDDSPSASEAIEALLREG